jgi:hypothetical protein
VLFISLKRRKADLSDACNNGSKHYTEVNNLDSVHNGKHYKRLYHKPAHLESQKASISSRAIQETPGKL